MAGKGDWWFEVSDNDRIDLLPEKKRYEPGETAVFQVRMPFRSATALVTVEREGVMEAWVKQISGKQPVIEVPIRGHMHRIASSPPSWCGVAYPGSYRRPWSTSGGLRINWGLRRSRSDGRRMS